jgi:hypothetical protein
MAASKNRGKISLFRSAPVRLVRHYDYIKAYTFIFTYIAFSYSEMLVETYLFVRWNLRKRVDFFIFG